MNDQTMFFLYNKDSFYLINDAKNIINIDYVEEHDETNIENHVAYRVYIFSVADIEMSYAIPDVNNIQIKNTEYLLCLKEPNDNYVPKKIKIPETTDELHCIIDTIISSMCSAVDKNMLQEIINVRPKIIMRFKHGSTQIKLQLNKPIIFTAEHKVVSLVYPNVVLEYIPSIGHVVNPNKLIESAKVYFARVVFYNEEKSLVRFLRNTKKLLGADFIDDLLNSIGE